MNIARIVVFVGVIALQVCFAMNGIAVTSAEWAPTSQYGHNRSELQAHYIENDQVVSSRVLFEFENIDQEWQSLHSPSINPAGTHVVFSRRKAARSDNRALHTFVSIADIESATWKDIIELEEHPSAIWWLHDGGIVVLSGNRCSLDKYTITLSGGQIAISKKRIGQFKDNSQHFYVDISMDAKYISYRVYKGTCDGSEGISTAFAGPIPSDPSVLMGRDYGSFRSTCGCGNGVSPLGDFFACFMGSGHGTMGFETRDGTRVGDVTVENVKQWSNTSSNVSGGTDYSQGWAVNSNDWTVVSLGCDSRFMMQGADQWCINRTGQKAINTTLGCSDSIKKSFGRGDLWVSNQDEVIPELWSYIENRDSERQKWKDIMAGLPDSVAGGGVSASIRPAHNRHNTIQIDNQNNSLGLPFKTSGMDNVDVYSLDGRKVVSARDMRQSIPNAVTLSGVGMIVVRESGGKRPFVKFVW